MVQNPATINTLGLEEGMVKKLMMKSPQKYIVGADVGGTYCDGYLLAGNQVKTVKILSTGRLRAIISKKKKRNTYLLKHNWALPYTGVLEGCICYIDSIHIANVNFSKDYKEVTFDHPVKVKDEAVIEFGIDAEAPVFAAHLLTGIPVHQALKDVELRVGTTKATNAMLERKGTACVWITNEGLKDLLYIKTQQRPDLFQLNIPEPVCYHSQVIECRARLNARGQITNPLTKKELKKVSEALPKDKSIPIAISFLHSYKNAVHELELKKYLFSEGYPDVSCSSELHPSIHILPRSETAVCNAYLNPIMRQFIASMASSTERLFMMTSAGQIIPGHLFKAKDGLLSGPAGGIKAAEIIAYTYNIKNLITFDMGGTSTDTARIDGHADLKFKTRIGASEIASPSFAIETVAAGGGSIIDFKYGRFTVGPESAGANPGPACYGYGGPFTITDLKLLQGKLVPHAFNIPIYLNAAEYRFRALLKKAKLNTSKAKWSGILSGIELIANETMADAIRKISLGRGYNTSGYTLLVFGGAGGLHACAIAEILDIQHILIPYHAGILSAQGIAQTPRQSMKTRQVNEPLQQCNSSLAQWYSALYAQAMNELVDCERGSIRILHHKVYLRYKGQHQTIPLDWKKGKNLKPAFEKAYHRMHAVTLDHTMEVESISITLQSITGKAQRNKLISKGKIRRAHAKKKLQWDQLSPGEKIIGPMTIYSNQATVSVESGWQGIVQSNLDLFCSKIASQPKPLKWSKAIELELFSNRFRSIAEQMGAQLQFSAFSVNVKERLDFSCAILDPQARLIANAPHIPVHLGSLGICARLILNDYSLEQGDVIICNHPLYGGSHLPDITLIKAVYSGTTLIGYVINRAHHAEIGGMTPGSMPPFAKNLSEEGVVFPPMYLIKKGKPQWEEIQQKLNALPYPSRNVPSNLLDIQAALLALNAGEEKLHTLCKQFGPAYIMEQMHSVLSHSSQLMKSWMKKKHGFKAMAVEYMDDGRILKVKATVTSQKIVFDFKGTGPVHSGNLNANKAIVHSVVLYLLRLLVNENVPLNEGLAANIEINIPESFIHPHFVLDPFLCPAVVGGNTEVSQRLTDTLIKAFRLAACSQGTMNNFLFGNDRYSYYETIGGGVGAGPGFAGRSAVHQHMTNTKITDPEELELRYPVRLERFEIRLHSGGGGKYKGGNGIIRQITFLEPMTVTILAQHRQQYPYGMKGGQQGALGKQFHLTPKGEKEVSANQIIEVKPGEGIRIETPGGGGWGEAIDLLNA